ncbi:MAG: hypothetical protein NTY38_18035, partial [Acidobacteria bacterium]|nr:hypothetical protein [Acidobacteriota bacterium]
MGPSLSPDGNQVAFSWDGPDGNRQIYVQVIGGGTPLRLTNGRQPATEPSWSPDGQQLAFVRLNQGVFVVSALGGSERRVLPAGWSPCWTADSRALIVVTQKFPSDPARLQLVPLDAGTTADLTNPPPGGHGDSYPALSPDGKSVAMIRWANWSTGDVYVVPITGGEPKRITRHGAVMFGVAWTSDGASVVFSSDHRSPGSWHLWRAAVSGAPDGRTELVPGVERMARFPAISKANGIGGSRLVYQSSVIDPNIWAMQLPDPHDRPAQPGKPHQLIASTLEDVTPQFSPDGSRLAFASDRTGHWEIYTSAPDGSGVTQLTSIRGPHVGSARWSPNGNQLAFNVNQNPRRSLWSMQSDGSGRKLLMRGDYVDARAAYSNDGRWIFFRSNRSGSEQLWRVAAEGGEPVRLTTGCALEPIAAPDGIHVYYTRVDEPGLWSVPIGGGPEVRVLDRVPHGYWAVRRNGVYFFDFTDAPLEGPYP